MLDESSLIQNESSKRSKFILERLNFDNVILLSGTPTNGKYENLWSQLHLLGWDISKDLFWKQYIVYEWQDNDGFPVKVVKDYKNVERLKYKLRQHGAQFLKTEDVMTLPDQIEQIIKIPVIKEYREFRENSITKIKDVTLVGDTITRQILHERQLCGHYNKNKLNAFRDIIESTSDRLIVFYNFNAELDQLRTIADELNRPHGAVNGNEKNLEPYEAYDNSITFVQYQAGAMGLNLQKANKIVYFTLPLGKGSCGLWEQSKKRIHRIGQNQSCFYYYLLCKNSIEEKNLRMLKLGKDLTDELFVEVGDKS
jgi:SNF2 family DNA or RNA helicase